MNVGSIPYRAPGHKRPALAAVLSALVPGLGQWYAGRLRRAVIFVVPTLAAAGVLVAVASRGLARILELAVQPAVLWALLAANLLVLVWRLASVVDAFRLTNRGFAWPGWLTTGIAALVVVFVATPHIVVTSYGLNAIDLLETVFVNDDTVAAGLDAGSRPPPFPASDFAGDTVLDPRLQPTVQVATLTSNRNMVYREGIGDPEAVEAWEAIVTGASVSGARDLLPADEVEDIDRITILLAGGDGGPGRGGSRTDSIMVASLDTQTGRAALFSIPRNMARFPLPDHLATAFIEQERQLAPYVPRSEWTDTDGDGRTEPPAFVSCRCFPDQINALYPWSRTWTTTYPDEVQPGMAALRDTLEIMLGINIDFYALVDMRGFVRLVDALGGVRTYVLGHIVTEVSPYEEDGEWISVDLQPGWQRLNGAEALAYMRERKTANDYVRTQRQRCLLKAVAGAADPGTIVRRFNAIADAVKRSVKTDVPLELLPTLIRHAATLDFDDIVTVGFIPPEYAPERDHKGHPIPDLGRIQAAVNRALSGEADATFETGPDSECRL
jgi:LCP family protein required for cell wall assembly